ncbi:hypothetical protein [Saccharospirillum salsuginis]|uniref:Uncharacterized protein n=1 Tax=Saccharospirillum salsuginis TaxID=418750 RepID=A0A918N928_9GAMM|nr:hypothetical protein [Saccharospirillum salsuginis]GGX52568.1 hypothetical protein GCM10007392_19920 [Saccharospirillum salsuginis]
MPERIYTVTEAYGRTLGGETPIGAYATLATRQGSFHAPDLDEADELTVRFQGMELPCFARPLGPPSADGHHRTLELAADALAGLWHTADSWPDDAVLALNLASCHNPTPNWDRLRADLIHTLELAGELALAGWCEHALWFPLHRPEDWQAIEPNQTVIWLSADSLLNQSTVKKLAGRVATRYFDAGLILGEAATAVRLDSQPGVGKPRLTIHTDALTPLDREQPALTGFNPYSEALVAHLDPGQKHEVRWQRWLDQYPCPSPFDRIQSLPAVLGFGYVGSAGPGLNVLCALGRQRLPCPPATRQWMFHQSLDNRYQLMVLDVPMNNASHPTTQAPEQKGGLSG